MIAGNETKDALALIEENLHVAVTKIGVKEIRQAIGLYAFGRMDAEDLISIVLKKARELKANVLFYKENDPEFAKWLNSPDAQITLGIVDAFVRSEIKSKDEVEQELGQES